MNLRASSFLIDRARLASPRHHKEGLWKLAKQAPPDVLRTRSTFSIMPAQRHPLASPPFRLYLTRERSVIWRMVASAPVGIVLRWAAVEAPLLAGSQLVWAPPVVFW